MSTIKAKRIQQIVVGSTNQPLTLGGVASDASDAKIVIESNGNMTLNQVVGIKFPATQVPSADPTTLDDYEEGTFTPNIRGETTAGTATYTNQQGKYTKIGRVVHFQIYLNWNSLTGTGAMIITGLPFANGSVLGAVTVAYPNSITLTANNIITAHINASAIYLTSYPSGGGAVSFVQCDASGELILSGTYMI